MRRLLLALLLLFGSQAFADEAFVSVCDRHPEVQTMLVTNVKSACDRISKKQLDQVTVLIFAGNIHELKARDFNGLNHLETLLIANTEVKTKDFPVGLFERLGQLRNLIIRNAHFSDFPKSEISNLSELEHFELIDSDVGKLASDFFAGKEKIKTLGLPSSSIRNEQYSGLKSVSTLNIRNGNVSHLSKTFFSSFPALSSLVLADASLEGARPDMFASLGPLVSFTLIDVDLKPLAEQRVAWPADFGSVSIGFFVQPAILPKGLFDHLPVRVTQIQLGPAPDLETIPDNFFIHLKHSPIVIISGAPLSKTNMDAFNGVAVRGLPTNFGVTTTGGTSEEWAP